MSIKVASLEQFFQGQFIPVKFEKVDENTWQAEVTPAQDFHSLFPYPIYSAITHRLVNNTFAKISQVRLERNSNFIPTCQVTLTFDDTCSMSLMLSLLDNVPLLFEEAVLEFELEGADCFVNCMKANCSFGSIPTVLKQVIRHPRKQKCTQLRYANLELLALLQFKPDTQWEIWKKQFKLQFDYVHYWQKDSVSYLQDCSVAIAQPNSIMLEQANLNVKNVIFTKEYTTLVCSFSEFVTVSIKYPTNGSSNIRVTIDFKPNYTFCLFDCQSMLQAFNVTLATKKIAAYILLHSFSIRMRMDLPSMKLIPLEDVEGDSFDAVMCDNHELRFLFKGLVRFEVLKSPMSGSINAKRQLIIRMSPDLVGYQGNNKFRNTQKHYFSSFPPFVPKCTILNIVKMTGHSFLNKHDLQAYGYIEIASCSVDTNMMEMILRVAEQHSILLSWNGVTNKLTMRKQGQLIRLVETAFASFSTLASFPGDILVFCKK